jgi:hypothetical protein
MNITSPGLGAILAFLVIVAAFVLALVSNMTWLFAALFMGLGLAVLLRGPG